MTAATVVVPGQHHEDVNEVGRRWRTGVLLVILADVAFVVALIFSYFYLRGLNTEGNWITPGSHTATIWVSWAIAAVLVLAALAYRAGNLGIRMGSQQRLVLGTGVAVLLVVADTVAQVAQITSLPFKPDANAYASTSYVMTGANLFHLLLTVFIGLGIWNRSRLGKFTQQSFWQVDIVAIWYGWIAVAALGSALTTSFIASPNHFHP